MSEGPKPSGITGPGTWAEQRRFPSHEAGGGVVPCRGEVVSLSECREGVVHYLGTHPSCPLWGAGPWKGPPLVLAWVVACLGIQCQ